MTSSYIYFYTIKVHICDRNSIKNKNNKFYKKT